MNSVRPRLITYTAKPLLASMNEAAAGLKGQRGRVWPHRSGLASKAVTVAMTMVKWCKTYLSQETLLIQNTACKIDIFGKRCPEATRKVISPCLIT